MLQQAKGVGAKVDAAALAQGVALPSLADDFLRSLVGWPAAVEIVAQPVESGHHRLADGACLEAEVLQHGRQIAPDAAVVFGQSQVIDIVGRADQGADALQRLLKHFSGDLRENLAAHRLVGQGRVKQRPAGLRQGGRGGIHVLERPQPGFFVGLHGIAEQAAQQRFQDFQRVVLRLGTVGKTRQGGNLAQRNAGCRRQGDAQLADRLQR